MIFFNKSVEVIGFANHIDLIQTQKHFANKYAAHIDHDALHIQMPKGHIFVFDYAVVVFWGVNPEKIKQYTKELMSLASKAHLEQLDTYEFNKVDEQGEHLSVSNNSLVLNNYRTNTLLALSHALAQSAKLQHYEALAQSTISKNQYLIDMLAKNGTIQLNRKQLAKLRGQLFQTKTEILLHYNLLDTPEFFWNFPELEHYYAGLNRYLEIKPRIDILNLKLQTIQDLFDMLASEQNHKHSSFLEWIIIILIAIEIVIFFGEYFNIIA